MSEHVKYMLEEITESLNGIVDNSLVFTAIELNTHETVLGLVGIDEDSDTLVVYLPRLLYTLDQNDISVSFGFTNYSPFIHETSAVSLNPDLVVSMYTASLELHTAYFKYWRERVLSLQDVDNPDTNGYYVDEHSKFS